MQEYKLNRDWIKALEHTSICVCVWVCMKEYGFCSVAHAEYEGISYSTYNKRKLYIIYVLIYNIALFFRPDYSVKIHYTVCRGAFKAM